MADWGEDFVLSAYRGGLVFLSCIIPSCRVSYEISKQDVWRIFKELE